MPIQYGGGGGGSGAGSVTFSAHMANTQALTSLATAVLVYDTVDWNVGGGTFNVGTGVYTVPSAGKYLVCAGFRVNDAQGEADIFCVQNSTTIYPTSPTVTAGSIFANITAVVANCAKGDTLEIEVYISGANTHTNVTSKFNTFQVTRIA